MNAKMLEMIDECEWLLVKAKKEKDAVRIAHLEGRKQGLVEALSLYRSENRHSNNKEQK